LRKERRFGSTWAGRGREGRMRERESEGKRKESQERRVYRGENTVADE
jgi:hypothetical protein